MDYTTFADIDGDGDFDVLGFAEVDGIIILTGTTISKIRALQQHRVSRLRHNPLD